MTDRRIVLSTLGAALGALAGSAALAETGKGRGQKAGLSPVKRLVARNGAAELEVRVQGKGPAVVLIPSLGRGAADFDTLAAQLAAGGFTVIRPEPRGIGASKGELAGLTQDVLAADVLAAMDAAGAKDAVVLGHAFGNRVARRFATLHPDRVRAVILAACGGKVAMTEATKAHFERCFDLNLPTQERLKDVAYAFFAPGHDPAVWTDGWWPQAARAQQGSGAGLSHADWWAAGGRPMLALQGMNDRVAPPGNAEQLKVDLGDQVEIVHIDMAGHAMLPEQPGRIGREVLRFARVHS